MKKDFSQVKEVLEVFSTPMVYHPGGWEDTLPEAIKNQVIPQRLDLALRGEWDRATDAEALCYLCTASLVQPFDSDWTSIYLWQAAEVLPQVRQAIPDTPQKLSDWQKSQLDELKCKIRSSQRKKKEVTNMGPNLKVVLEIREGDVEVIMGRDGVDPRWHHVIGDLNDALAAVPGIVEEAEEHWKDYPRNPKAEVPKAKVESKPPAPKAPDLPLLAQDKGSTGSVSEKAQESTGLVPEVVAEVKPGQTEEKAEVVAEVRGPYATVQEALRAEEPTEPKEVHFRSPRVEKVEYFLKDGRGPYATVQEALDGLGIPKDKRPTHNRYSRLSKGLQEAIEMREVV